MAKGPDRLYYVIAEDDKALYERLNEEFQKRMSNKNQFLLAMAVGFKEGNFRSFGKKVSFVRTEYLNDEDKALINSVAIKETGGVEVLSKTEEVFRIAEGYAHGGIRLLNTQITSKQFGSFFKQFEKEVVEIYRGLDLDDEKENPSS
ncbi:MAG: hypothetical protein E3J71_09650 [Candidatus Stahlbacteria bacterium]|nr:MAG: hypothetical protein E3J71_09650 [Candidatus Stahlbacteria bacterium]